jgi:hypothetical protein
MRRRRPVLTASRRGWVALPVAALALMLAPAGGRAGIIFTTGATPADAAVRALADAPANTNIGAFTVLGTLGTSTTAFGLETGNGPNLLRVVTDTPLAAPRAGPASGIAAVVETLLLLKAHGVLNPPGPARVEAFSSDDLFTTATLTPAGGVTGFSALGLNPQAPTPQGGMGFFSLTATDQFGATFTSPVFTLGGGQNVVDALAQDGAVITRLTLTAYSDRGGTAPAALIQDIRQVSVALAPAAAPEPATLASALSGLAACGLAGLRRRFRKRAAS